MTPVPDGHLPEWLCRAAVWVGPFSEGYLKSSFKRQLTIEHREHELYNLEATHSPFLPSWPSAVNSLMRVLKRKAEAESSMFHSRDHCSSIEVPSRRAPNSVPNRVTQPLPHKPLHSLICITVAIGDMLTILLLLALRAY